MHGSCLVEEKSIQAQAERVSREILCPRSAAISLGQSHQIIQHDECEYDDEYDESHLLSYRPLPKTERLAPRTASVR